MQRIFLFFAVLMFVTVLSVALEAAPRYGVAVSTVISNTATISAANATTQIATYIDTSVGGVYGETTQKTTSPDTKLIGVGDTAYFYYKVNNTSNRSDSFQVKISALVYPNGAANWSATLLKSTDDLTGAGRGDSFIIGPIAEDGNETFAVRIVSSSNIPEALNDSAAYCTTTITAYSAVFTGQYTGDNDTIYAINNTSSIFYDTAIISAAVFTVTQNCTGVTRGGVVIENPIPGASLWYKITYSNTGSGNGNNVFLYIKIDTANVEYSDSTVGTATGWTFYYSTQVNPTPAFGVGGGEWTAGEPAAATKKLVTYIKWDKGTVAPTEDDMTLGYKVIIK